MSPISFEQLPREARNRLFVAGVVTVCFILACVAGSFLPRVGRLSHLTIRFEGFPRNTEYVNVVTVVDEAERGRVKIWDTYVPMSATGGLRRDDDQLNGRGVTGPEGTRLYVRRERGAVRYGIVIRPFTADGSEVNNRAARVHWISPADFDEADRTGTIDIPPFENLAPFDIAAIH